MASTLVLLLLVSLASASHHMGGRTSYDYKGRNRDGTYKVHFYNRDVYDNCHNTHYWSCSSGDCGTLQENSYQYKAIIDSSTNAPVNENLWCETESIQTRHVSGDKPFTMRARGCCWIQTANNVNTWRLTLNVDLGTRSDTKEPNKSPDFGIVPLLRTPENCPRTYELVHFDPDGDKVRCRYGNIPNLECGTCNQPSGFYLNQDTCTLQYTRARYNSRVYGFEMMVEDFPRVPITLSYSDGSQTTKNPISMTKSTRVQAPTTTTAAPTTHPWWWWHTTTPAAQTTTHPWWWWHTTTPAVPAATTVAPTTTPAAQTTTHAGPTITHHWWWWYTTTTPAPTTTTAAPGAPTVAPTTTPAAQTTTHPWWWWHTTTPAVPAATTVAPTTTPAAQTTTHPWWWWHTTTLAAPTTTTAAPPTTHSWWWWHKTTTPSPTTTHPWWWWHTTTPAAPTTTPNAAKVGAVTPLSKQPLQFSFLVDRAVHSCLPGDYLPKYLSPTPDNGVHIHTEVGKEVEIRVKAVSKYSKIDNIIISGPQKTKKHKNTHDEFSITWTPIQDDLGNHYVLCFVVEAKIGSNVYQSDMRCVILDVGNKLVDAHVICTESTMTVEVDRAMCFHISEDHLRLSDPSNVVCNLKTHSNKTHIIAVFPLNACGTQIEEDNEYLKFKNEITTVDNPRDTISRKNLLEIQFFCQYPKRGRVSDSFLAHRKSVTVWEKGMGQFEYEFEFYPDTQFRTMIDPSSYPLEYTLGNRIFMQIEAKSSVNNTVLFVESCRAAPYDNPNYKPVYSIIEDGCPVDRSVRIHNPSHPGEFRMSLEAFKFIGFHDQVYISCSVLMCKAGDPNTRCAQGCRKVKTFSPGRRKREIVTQSSAHLISQGPLRLRRSAERADSPVMNLNLNLIFIAGCLLAAVGMISGVNLYKAKITKAKYQPLLTFEG